MIFNSKFSYKPSEEFYKIKEKILRWKKYINYYEDDNYQIDEVRKNALKAAKSIKNNIPGQIFSISDSKLEWIRQCSSNSVVNILYIHGGGFIAGSLDNHRPFAKILSTELDANILMIDYPLSPENKFPLQLLNAVEAFKFMKNSTPKFYYNGIMGDSAGANIGLSLILSSLSQKADYKPDFGIFMSGLFDLSFESHSLEYNKKNDFVLKPEFLHFCTDFYVNKCVEKKNPLLSPVYANYNQCCDLFFQVGSHEILLDDSIRCHNKALESNANSILSIWPWMMHSFQSYYPYFPESVFAVREIGYFVKKTISKPG